jgi:hypothetical protein
MTGTEIVAITGAITTPTIAVAGYLFNHWGSKNDRAAARNLAQDAHAHERSLRQSERAYEARSMAYRMVLEWALRTIQQIELTAPIVSTNLTPSPPDSLSEEHYNEMRVELAAHGSAEVEEAFEEYRTAARRFFVHAGIVERHEQQSSTGVFEAMEKRDEVRDEAHDVYERLVTTIKDELATL